MTLYYLHYNNYYNRVVKSFESLSEYLVLPYYDNVKTENVAFNPNDGTDTEQVINLSASNFTYDYLIVADGSVIVSRWFIIEAKRLRNGQYKLTLRRDMFADSIDIVLDAPAFIEKATLNQDDPLIFNKEEMTFNQIKTSELLLKDDSKCPWIVGYFARKDGEGNYTRLQGTAQNVNPTDITVPRIGMWEYFRYTNGAKFKANYSLAYNFKSQFWVAVGDDVEDGYFEYTLTSGGSVSRENSDSVLRIAFLQDRYIDNSVFENAFASSLSTMNSSAISDLDLKSSSELSNFLALQGKTIYDTETSKTYRITIVNNGRVNNITTSVNSTVNNLIRNSLSTITGVVDVYDPPFGILYVYSVDEYYISLTEIESSVVNYDIHTLRYHLNDAPYDMFAIPYADGITIKNTGGPGWTDITTNKLLAFNVVMAIAEKYSSESAKYLYDIQLLPYCPIRNIIEEDCLDIKNNEVCFSRITRGEDTVGVIFNCYESSFSFDIPLEEPVVIEDKKIESQTNMYRLCSPNYNGVFEFNAAKNNGIERFNVDCTYIPYNPYIHINPDFSELYGQDFNDSRGLVCGGDFSLPIISNAWESYQLSNKNYQQIFNRQIENMEVNNKLQNIKTATSGILGSISGAVGGLATGGIGGAIAGGIASFIGGGADYALQKAGQAEAIDFTKDQFGYALGNIQALPNGLSKTTAYTVNNKIFPFLEFYTCTEEEKTALENKIRYNGMTVMRIGTIREFLRKERTYIKGKLIRVEGIEEDFHYINELANEFNKGVFI